VSGPSWGSLTGFWVGRFTYGRNAKKSIAVRYLVLWVGSGMQIKFVAFWNIRWLMHRPQVLDMQMIRRRFHVTVTRRTWALLRDRCFPCAQCRLPSARRQSIPAATASATDTSRAGSPPPSEALPYPSWWTSGICGEIRYLILYSPHLIVVTITITRPSFALHY